MIKIAMLFPYAPSYRETIYRLMDQEFDVDWYFCGNAQRNLKLLNYDLLETCNLEMTEKFIGPFSIYKGISKLNLEKYDVLVIAGVYQCLTEWQIALKYGRCKKKPKLFFWTHGMYGKESAFRKLVKSFLYKSSDGILLYGNYARDLMIKQGFDPQKLFVIHNSLDYKKQLNLRCELNSSLIYSNYFGNNNKTLIFIGRLTPVKQLDKLVAAVDLLKRRGEMYNLVFIGDGEMRASLQEEVKKRSLVEQTWFYGECYDEKINAELIYNADLCIAPGNIGLTAMHSLMFGCPAISHDDFSWQMPEFEAITPYKTGMFFKYNDVNSLADSISEWFKVNGNMRDQIRNACYYEIDTQWTPEFQIKVLKNAFEIIENGHITKNL